MRVAKKSKKVALFDGMRASLLDANNIFVGNLLANEQITDLSFNEDNEHLISAVTDEGLYEWDLRKMQVCKL